MSKNYETYSKIPDDSPVWNPVTQNLVYESITRKIDFEDKSILDLGCGRADFLRYLLMSSLPFGFYTGIDIVEKLIAQAQVPSISHTHFIIGDFMEEELPKVDYTLALASIEILEESITTHENARFPMLIRKMWETSKEGIVLALQSNYAPVEFVDDSWFADPLLTIIELEIYTDRVYLDHTYAPHFFTLIALKGETPWEVQGGIGKNILGRDQHGSKY